MAELNTKLSYGAGAKAGLYAGIIFAIAEMILNVFMGKSFFGPLRLIGSMILGAEALNPRYSLAVSAVTGMAWHLLLSVAFGLVFILSLSIIKQRSASPAATVSYATVFGFLLWIVNFRIIAPAFWPQFQNVNAFWNGFVAHTFFFGTVLGIYLNNYRTSGYVAAPRHAA